MPWKVFSESNRYCVYRVNEAGERQGEALKCYPDKAAATRYLQALYANEPDAQKASTPLPTKSVRVAGFVEPVRQDKFREAGSAKKFALHVLANPFYGPYEGKDEHGEWFSPRTNFHEDKWPLPPVVYYHGFNEDGTPQAEPEFVGATTKRWVDEKGVWYKVEVDDDHPRAKQLLTAAEEDRLRVSSGSIPQLVRVDPKGEIIHWPNVEISLIDVEGNRRPANPYAVALLSAKNIYAKAGLDWPDDPLLEADDGGASANAQVDAGERGEHTEGENEMDPETVKQMVQEALSQYEQQRIEQEEAERAKKAEIEQAVKSATEDLKKELEAVKAKANRLPGGSEAPAVIRRSKYDYLRPSEHAMALALKALYPYRFGRVEGQELFDLAVKADAMRQRGDTDANACDYALHMLAIKAAGLGKPIPLTEKGYLAIKADEIMYTTLTGYGLEWVEHLYSTTLWEQIRADRRVFQKLPQKEIPDGFDGVNIKLESTDPSWYLVSEATDTNATTGRPDATITSSQFATAEKLITVKKVGARVLFSGELTEDSLIRVAPHATMKLRESAGEMLEHIVIDGDTDTSATTNINDIGGTPAGTEPFLAVNGFRKLPLITNTANSRDASGSLSEDDYILTMQLLGTAGINAELGKCSFIVDMPTYWKTLQLSTLKTRDVFSQATVENGKLVALWGYDLIPSAFMHKMSSARKANTAGKIDQDTTSNNTTGAILGVRWDQWDFRWKRRMTLETGRWPEADTNQIVAMMRLGLGYRDNEASAISYNVGV